MDLTVGHGRISFLEKQGIRPEGLMVITAMLMN